MWQLGGASSELVVQIMASADDNIAPDGPVRIQRTLESVQSTRDRIAHHMVIAIAASALMLSVPLRSIALLLLGYDELSESAVHLVFLALKLVILPLVAVTAYQLVRWNDSGGVSLSHQAVRRGLPVLLALTIAIVVVLVGQNPIDIEGNSLRAFNFTVLETWLYFLTLGTLLPSLLRARRLLIALWVAMAVVALGHFDFLSLTLDVSLLEPERAGIYLAYGDAFAVMTCLVLAVMRRPLSQFVIAILGLIVAFTLYSRTSFFVLAATLWLNAFWRHPKLVAVSMVLIALPLATLLLGGGSAGALSEHRMFAFLHGNDGSVLERLTQFSMGMQGIRENWFFGDYGGQVASLGFIGAYMHNLLSYWRQFGLVFFLLWCGLAVALGRSWFWKAGCIDAQREERAIALLTPLTIIAVLVSRSYVFEYVWLTFGSWVVTAPRNVALCERDMTVESVHTAAN